MEERNDIILSVSVDGVGKSQSDLLSLAKTANATAREISNAFSSIRLGFDKDYGIHSLLKKHSIYGPSVKVTSGGSVYQRDIDKRLAFATQFITLGTGTKTGAHRWNVYENNLDKALKIAEFRKMRRDAVDGIFTMKDGSKVDLNGAGTKLLGWDGESNWVNDFYKQKDLKDKYNNLSQEQKDELKKKSELGPDKPTFASDKSNDNKTKSLRSKFSLLSSYKSLPLIASFWALNKAVMASVRTIETFNASVQDWFNLFKSSLASGLSNGSSAKDLVHQGNLLRMLGGDAASASAWNAKFATAKAMMAYGGSGGKFMEAARLFGVNVFGSGEMGFATNKEFMENIARRMGTLSQGGKLALANTVGLTPEQFWAVKDGYKSYIDRYNKAQMSYSRMDKDGVGDLYDYRSAAINENLVAAWGKFIILAKDLGRILSIALIPYLTKFINVINWFLKVINNGLGWIFKLFGIVSEAVLNNNGALKNPEAGLDAKVSAHDDYVRTLDQITNNNRSVKIENVNITTSENLSDSNAVAFGRGIGDGILRDVNIFSGNGIGRRALA
jgi:hypothetical protein